MKITIYGKPIAKKRPRFVRKGKFVQAYNDQETEEGRFLLAVKNQVTECLKTPISITCWLGMPRPKNHYRTGKNSGLLKDNVPYFHSKKPDLDNLLKFVFDCLNGIAWQDDSQIAKINAVKAYSEEPRTFILIESIE